VNKGGMKSTSQSGAVSDREVLQLEKELNEKESHYEVAQNTFYEMTNALKELKDRQPEIGTLISQHQFEIESSNNELKNLKVRLAELKRTSDSITSNDRDVSAAELKVRELKADYDQLLDQSKEIQNKIDELQEKIMQVGGVKLRLQDSKVDGVKQQIEIVTNKLNSGKVLLKKLENELKRYNKSKAEKEKEIEATVKELASIEIAYEERIKELESCETELKKLADDKDDQDSKAELLKQDLDEKQVTVNELRSAEIEIENDLKTHSASIEKDTRHLNNYHDALNSLEVIDYSQLLAFLDNEEEISKYTNPSISELSPDEIEALDIKRIEEKVNQLSDFISKSKVNTDVLEEFSRRATEYNSRKTDLNDAVKERDDIKKMSEDLKKKRLDEFMEGFNIISGTLKDMYQMITMGGNAELELVDSLDPFSEGILFSVMPPKKSWKNISNLSGGEKTLSSLALVFALHTYKPTPLYVMDEIDAALDFRNVSIVANYIKERTKNAQFVVISLRNNMFELAQQLVGIYKVNNMTRSITLQNRDMLGN
jgi:structural maintenance of chromosome 4